MRSAQELSATMHALLKIDAQIQAPSVSKPRTCTSNLSTLSSKVLKDVLAVASHSSLSQFLYKRHLIIILKQVSIAFQQGRISTEQLALLVTPTQHIYIYQHNTQHIHFLLFLLFAEDVVKQHVSKLKRTHRNSDANRDNISDLTRTTAITTDQAAIKQHLTREKHFNRSLSFLVTHDII